MSEGSKRIRELNDQFRTTFDQRYGRILLTQGIMTKGATFVNAVTKAVQGFTAFNEGNDPHSEHDFGSVEVDGETVFFKIDYYDTKFKYGSPNPADPSVTQRVITIMLAEEY